MAEDVYHDAVEAGEKLLKDAEAAGSVLDAEKSGVAPEEAMRRLKEGNARYVAGRAKPRDYTAGRAARADGQAPFAALVSCADSRVAPELTFDQEPGDLFVVRLAGNLVNADVLASLEYAVAFLGTATIVVLGHSGCGAVDAAIKVHDRNEILPGHLDQMTVAMLPAVARAKEKVGAGDAKALLDASIAQNARLSALRLTSRSATLAEAMKAGDLTIHAAVYDIATGEVRFLDA